MMALLHEMELDEDVLLHVSSRFEEDLAAALDLGIDAAYVDRHRNPLPMDVEVKHAVPDLDKLAERLFRPARRGRGRRPGARPGTRK